MIDFATNPPISPSQAARKLGRLRADKPVSPVTVFRWCSQGLLVNGRRIKLAGFRVGRTWATTESALQDFLDALNSNSETEPTPRSPAQRRRESSNASRKLDAMKVGV